MRTKTRKECRRRFVHYTKETETAAFRRVERLSGLRATKKNYIHVGNGYNQWAAKATKVPAGFKETDIDSNYIDQYQCRDARSKRKGDLDLAAWTKKEKGQWLTIADISKLRKGDKLEVVLLDRNITDTVTAAGIKSNKLYPAATFFKGARAIYEHKSGLQGCLALQDNIVLDPFEFHVEIENRNDWYPLRDGVLPAKDPQRFLKLLGKRTPWSAMDPATHVGYRGPMISWSAVASGPPVYLYAA